MADDLLDGQGTLIVDGERIDAHYVITVRRVGVRRLRADGQLSVAREHSAALARAFGEGRASLELADGQLLPIVPSDVGMIGGLASMAFVVAGPVPGYGP